MNSELFIQILLSVLGGIGVVTIRQLIALSNKVSSLDLKISVLGVKIEHLEHVVEKHEQQLTELKTRII